jgi:hypothetical protein
VGLAVPRDDSVKVTAEGGQRSVTFATPMGKVTVTLPDDLAGGDTISGTVVAEPAGDTERQRARARGALEGLVVEAEGRTARVRDSEFTWLLPGAPAEDTLRLVLREPGKRVIAAAAVPCPPASPPAVAGEYQLPEVVQEGHPATVRGVFDGIGGNSQVRLGGAVVPLLAESPRQLVFSVPSGAVGPLPLEVTEAGRAVTQGEARRLSVSLSAPKTTLRSGEQTVLQVTVRAGPGLSRPLSLELTNHTPGVVTIGGGDRQSFRVEPAAVDGEGIWRHELPLTGVRPGGFSVTTVCRGGECQIRHRYDAKCPPADEKYYVGKMGKPYYKGYRDRPDWYGDVTEHGGRQRYDEYLKSVVFNPRAARYSVGCDYTFVEVAAGGALEGGSWSVEAPPVTMEEWYANPGEARRCECPHRVKSYARVRIVGTISSRNLNGTAYVTVQAPARASTTADCGGSGITFQEVVNQTYTITSFSGEQAGTFGCSIGVPLGAPGASVDVLALLQQLSSLGEKHTLELAPVKCSLEHRFDGRFDEATRLVREIGWGDTPVRVSLQWQGKMDRLTVRLAVVFEEACLADQEPICSSQEMPKAKEAMVSSKQCR